MPLAIQITRPYEIQGRVYGAGDAVDPALFAPGKVEQLLAQRILRVVGRSLPPVVALRPIDLGAAVVRRGEIVPAELLSSTKRAQLLEQRYVEVAPELDILDAEDVTTAETPATTPKAPRRVKKHPRR